LRWKFFTTPITYRLNFFFRNQIPSMLYSLYAKSLGSPEQQKNAKLLKIITDRTLQMTSIFEHFTNHEWIFTMNNTLSLLSRFPPEQQSNFSLYSDLDWEKYWRFFAFGMQRFKIVIIIVFCCYLVFSLLFVCLFCFFFFSSSSS